MKNYLLSLLVLLALSIINDLNSANYDELYAYSKKNNLQMVVEIPAGTNKKYEYEYQKKVFEVEVNNGKKRIIDFLPYPGNYGYIPSTLLNSSNGGDGDALDVLLISEALNTGDIIEIVPIAILNLIDGNELDNKIIAVPLDESKRIINCSSYEELSLRYPNIISIIKIWFTSYKGNDVVEFKGWGGKTSAISEINNYLIEIN